MKVALACDHAGLPLKQAVIDTVRQAGHEVVDLGVNTPDPVDYPDVAEWVGRAVLDGRAERGIVLCGSGVGAAIAANKLHGIRAGLCHDTYTARQCVEHDDANVLALGGRVIGVELAAEVIRAFLAARFSGEERHVRRVGKIAALEGKGGGARS